MREATEVLACAWLTITSADRTDSGTKTRTSSPGEIDPEVADRARFPGDAADHSKGHRQPDTGCGELRDHQPDRVRQELACVSS